MKDILLNRFYLDKEKDIIVNLKKTDADEITYILETPNHNTGNLITNLAKELEYLKTEKRAEVAERIKVALGFGDLSENSE